MRIFHLGPIALHRPMGLRTSVFSLADKQRGVEGVDGVFVVPLAETRKGVQGYDYLTLDEFWSKLVGRYSVNCPSLIVFHGYFSFKSVVIALRLRQRNIPYVVTPRGGLMCAVRSRGKVKKRLSDWLIFNRYLARSIGVHYLTTAEMGNSIRHNRPFFVVGNGVDMTGFGDLETCRNASERRFIFVGRLDVFHKGLDRLVDAVAQASRILRRNGYKVELYGPGTPVELKVVNDHIERRGVKDLVILKGPVEGAAKIAALRSGGIFVHLSRYEGQPQAVLEALAMGLPVLCTDGANLGPEIDAFHLGWRVKEGTSEIAKRLAEIATSWIDTPEGAASRRKFVESQCSWTVNARRTVQGYRQLMAAHNME